MIRVSIQQIFQSIIERLQSTASVKTVFGDPIELKGKTIIPVAKVAYGFGAGAGTDKKTESGSGEGGAGAGGGIMVRPAGVLEITQEGSRFIPIGGRRRLIGALLIGLILGMLVAGRRSRRDRAEK